MKNKLFVLFVLGVTVLHVQNTFGIEVPNNQYEDYIERLTQTEKEIVRLKTATRMCTVTLDSLREKNLALELEVDSLRLVQNELSSKQTADKDEMNGKIDVTRSDILANESVVNRRTMVGVIIAIIVVILLLYVWYFLVKKMKIGKDTIEDIREAQNRLQEDSVKLDNKMIELMEKHIATIPQVSASTKTDHTLALKVADEITRIEVNLSRMDSSVKGYKQLSKAVERIKNNFLANGYEIVDMLGKPYDEGMRVIASFTEDDTIPEGTQIIKNITKPQVNYNGVMIQAAQIMVSQNI